MSVVDDIADSLTRIESVDNDEMNEQMVEDTHAVYPHALVYGASFTLEQAIAADIDDVLTFLQQPSSIEHWSYAYRQNSAEGNRNEVGIDLIDKLTQQSWQCNITVHTQAKVIDLRWRTSTGEHLLMHESIRLIKAPSALNKPGTILLWNCSHTPTNNQDQHITQMPCQEFWQQMPARRKIELNNIKLLLEHQAATLLEKNSGLSL